MNSVVITGATSFIGLAFAEICLKQGYKVFAVVHPGSKRLFVLDALKNPNLVIVPCEMAEFQRLPSLIKEQIDCFAHFAWSGTRGSQRMDEAMQNDDLANSLASYKAAVTLGASLYFDAGSQAEYGLVSGLISENTPCKPNTPYGESKLEAYRQISRLSSNSKARYLHPRFFSVYGPGDLESTMVMSTIRKMESNAPCNFTEAKQDWNYFFVKDLAINLFNLAFRTDEVGSFNFGSATTKPLKNFIVEMKEILHSTSALHFGTVPYPPTGCVSIIPDITRLKNAISYVEEYSFADGIVATAGSMK